MRSFGAIHGTALTGANLVFAVLLACLCTGAAKAEEKPGAFAWSWATSEKFCDQNCAGAIYAGKFLHTEMVQVFGIEDGFVPIWNWTYEESWIVAGTFSRRIGGFGRFIDIEAETGLAKRFGNISEVEVWGAVYFRWKAFPWNNYLRTTIGLSTRLNWASGVPEAERIRAINKKGRQLLHFFSPEMTFGLPSEPDWDMVLRIHHRSGWWVFPDIGGGAQFLVIGVRHTF
jgi:hypothetical protein